MVDLASKGSTRNVDVFSDEVFDPTEASEGDEGVYQISSKTDNPGLLFCFGKTMGRRPGLNRRIQYSHNGSLNNLIRE